MGISLLRFVSTWDELQHASIHICLETQAMQWPNGEVSEGLDACIQVACVPSSWVAGMGASNFSSKLTKRSNHIALT